MTTDTTLPAAAENPNDPNQDDSRQGPGRLIRQGRERARLGLSELANLTKLAPATLEALERDDFAALNEPVYVRGYYRKCAKALALPEQELLAAYEKVVSPRAPQAPTKLLLGGSETGSSLKKTRRRSATPWWWLLGLAFLLVLAAWFLRQEPTGRRAVLGEVPAAAKTVSSAAASAEPAPASATAAAEAAAPAAAPATADKPQSTNELATTPADSGEAPPAETVSESAVQPQAAPSAVVAIAAQPRLSTELSSLPPAGDLVLDFKSTSWVRIEDSEGKVLLSGVIQSGVHQALGGKAPYSIFLGNAPGVSVEYQGHSIDLKPYIKSNDTARFSVPAAAG